MAEEDDDAAAATSSPASQFDDDDDGLPRLLSLNHNSRRSSQPHYDPDDDPSTSSPPASPSSANPQKERGRLRIHNVGGSLTFLLQIALLAWGVRQLRSVLARRRQSKSGGNAGGRVNVMPYRPVDPPLFAHLSPAAVQKLVELDPTPHLLIDVRFPDAVRADSKLFEDAINIPETEVRGCLQLAETEWKSRFPNVMKPGRENLLVFLSTRGKRAQRAAAAAADLGYNGCCVLKGGIQALRSASSSSASTDNLQFLSRDAVALLLQRKEGITEDKNLGASVPHLIDVRRHDERVLYGNIKGSLHIQVEEWPKALAMDSTAWEKHYHVPKIGSDDLVILQCRTNRRASWAAQLAQDAGLKRCFVYRQGAFGWRLDPMVLPYDSYELGDVPPEPVKFQVEKVNEEAAELELQQLGLL